MLHYLLDSVQHCCAGKLGWRLQQAIRSQALFTVLGYQGAILLMAYVCHHTAEIAGGKGCCIFPGMGTFCVGGHAVPWPCILRPRQQVLCGACRLPSACCLCPLSSVKASPAVLGVVLAYAPGITVFDLAWEALGFGLISLPPLL